METHAPPWTLGEIAEWLGGNLDGPPNHRVERLVPAGSDDPEGLAFCESQKYLERIEESAVGSVLLGPGMQSSKPSVQVESPRLGFYTLLVASQRDLPLAGGIHPSSVIDPTAQVDASAQVGPFCVVGPRAAIGAHAKLHPFCYVGAQCRVGAECELFPGVVLYRDVVLGDRTLVHGGAILGADGFGYEWDGKRRVKIPQVGAVEIGADAEIGANTTVDRATVGETRIGDGTKIDNLVQVAHNVQIGEHGVVAGLTGIAGSTTLGNRIIVGGGVGFRDHVTVTDDVALGGRSGVAADITEPGEYFGSPAMPKREAVKSMLLIPRLPDLYNRIKQLEARLAELEKGRSE